MRNSVAPEVWPGWEKRCEVEAVLDWVGGADKSVEDTAAMRTGTRG